MEAKLDKLEEKKLSFPKFTVLPGMLSEEDGPAQMFLIFFLIMCGWNVPKIFLL